MNTRSEHYTAQILEYFQGKPEGRYAPYDVRMDIGISAHSWRWFTTRFVYPEGSEVRAKLAEIGVSIETILKTSRAGSGGRGFLTSTFVVSDGR